MDFLKAKYQQIRYLSEKDSWPPVLFKGYANLRYVYHKSEADTQKKLNASATSKMISPQVLIHEVFTPIEESLPNRILIEGNPGIGKQPLQEKYAISGLRVLSSHLINLCSYYSVETQVFKTLLL